MTLFCPDLNVWLALSDRHHAHHGEAWNWLRSLPDSSQVLFCRFTQLGLLRLLTNPAVMGAETLTSREAWNVFDRWMGDPFITFHPEPLNIESTFREATLSTTAKNSSSWIGDCYLLAHAKESGATLVTFDKALLSLASKRGCRAVRC
jgi:toxin-antitoxin system PIN domain toxin